MKKFKQILAILLTVICLLNFKPYTAHADDNGYYIKNMDVQVVANDKREFQVKETLDVYFNEERHGIIRSIPKSTQLEDYSIANIKVEGAPFVKEVGENLEIKIGDEDETIEGDKKYIITYTMKYYDDEQSDGDYIYLNVLGHEWDTYIENFTSTITYPENATLNDLSVTDGPYGSRSCTYADYKVEKNKIQVWSKERMDSFCGITINAKLNEGTFKNAPIRKYPYTVKKDIINAEITNQKEYLINRDLSIVINENTNDTNYFNLWSSTNPNNDYIKNVIINNNNINYNKSDNTIILPNKKGTYNFNVTYTIEPTLSAPIDFYMGDVYTEGKSEKVQLNITSPFSINDYSVDFTQKGVNSGTSRYDISLKDNTLTFKNKNTLYAGESVDLNLKINNDLFHRPTPFIYYLTILGSLLVLLIILYIYRKNKDNSPMTIAVEFYPPKDLNSADVAYAYKERITHNEVTTLLFYWASHKHIKIKINEDDSFVLTKTSNLDNKHKEYEKTLFNEIFKKGKNNTVTNTMLENAELKSIDYAINDIKSYFTEENILMDKKSYHTGRLLSLLGGIPILLSQIYNSIITHSSIIFGILIGIILTSILSIFANILIIKNKEKYSTKGKRKSIIWSIILSLIYLMICFTFLIFSELSDFLIFIILFISIFTIIISSLIPRRSEYGKDILSKIIGFKNFMETAEKDRLEVLLEEDPDYFYNTLPYAQVLGVTKKWADKFKNLTMKQPDYYDTYYPITSMYGMTHLMNSVDNVNSTMSSAVYTPPSDSSGFGGGGFSGGGGGGGGGSSW